MTEPAGDVRREALEKIASFTLSQFMGAHDMALECGNVARAALASLDAYKSAPPIRGKGNATQFVSALGTWISPPDLVDPTETPSTVPQAPAKGDKQ